MRLRDKRIDIIKGLAIISVLIVHTLSPLCLTSRIFHMDQAVPIFMLISGYVFTLSYKDREITDLKNCYNLNILEKRIKRLYIPFLTIYSLELLLYKIVSIVVTRNGGYKNMDISFIVKNLILGGFGPGSYYPVIMFQFLFVVPIIYIISYKKSNYSIPIFFAVGILFELFTYMYGINEGIYRLLIGRYIFAIALGSYLALNQNKMNKMLLYSGSILSVIYMYASVYFDYHIFGHTYWIPQQAPAYFYTAFLFITGMSFLPRNPGFMFTIIAEFGKASWHIFLIQMLYFVSIGLHEDSIYAVIINLMTCVTLGYLFYMIENTVYSRTMLQKQSQSIS